MAIKAVFGIISILAGLIVCAVGWFFTYVPWMEHDDGSHSSLSSAHDACSVDLIALFASEECSSIDAMWTMGNGAIVFGILFFILGCILLSPSRTKRTESERTPMTTTQQWRVNCPNCNAVNYGPIQQMQATINCGMCNVPFTPSSLEKM